MVHVPLDERLILVAQRPNKPWGVRSRLTDIYRKLDDRKLTLETLQVTLDKLLVQWRLAEPLTAFKFVTWAEWRKMNS